MTYSVVGVAHGSYFEETGFPSREEAEAYASRVIDGDIDSTVLVKREDD